MDTYNGIKRQELVRLYVVTFPQDTRNPLTFTNAQLRAALETRREAERGAVVNPQAAQAMKVEAKVIARPLVQKYAPNNLAEIRGQAGIVASLQAYLRAPHSKAFIFAGDTGTGKTSAAMIIAGELGCDVPQGAFGGLYVIASGELTVDTARKFMQDCRLSTWTGSGWHVVICNEADAMSYEASVVFLDALENLPPKTVVIFTTNNAGKMQRRFRNRCECHHFESDALLLTGEAQAFVDHVWQTELGHNHSPRVKHLAGAIEDGKLSFRALLGAIERVIRTGKLEAA